MGGYAGCCAGGCAGGCAGEGGVDFGHLHILFCWAICKTGFQFPEVFEEAPLRGCDDDCGEAWRQMAAGGVRSQLLYL